MSLIENFNMEEFVELRNTKDCEFFIKKYYTALNEKPSFKKLKKVGLKRRINKDYRKKATEYNSLVRRAKQNYSHFHAGCFNYLRFDWESIEKICAETFLEGIRLSQTHYMKICKKIEKLYDELEEY